MELTGSSALRASPEHQVLPVEAITPLASAAAGPGTEHILASMDAKGKDSPSRISAEAGPVPTAVEVVQDSADGANRPQRSNLRISLILVAVFLAEFIAALDYTIVATAVPVITHELNSATGYSWIGGAYPIAQAVASPIWARLSDIWGRKLIMLSAVTLFFTGSALCATAHNMSALIAGRVLQGVAAGGMSLLASIVICDLFSLRRRSLFMGLMELMWAVAGGVGPPLGGAFASLASWRWCFYINLPICGTSFVLLLLFLDVKHEKTSFKTGLRAIDWFGTFCFLAFTLMVLLGLDFGGNIFAWDSAKVLVLLIVGICMLGVFIYTEIKLARYPLVPLKILKDTSNLAAFGVALCEGLSTFPGDYYMPLYFQGAKGKTPVQSGVLLIPIVVSIASTSCLTSIVIHRFGRFRELLWVGTTLLCLGNGLFIMLDARTPIGQVLGLTVIFGLGAGMLFSPPLIAVQSRTTQADVATATSMISFARNISISVSAILGGVVFQNSMDSQTQKLRRSGLPLDTVSALSGKYAAANTGLATSITDITQRTAIRDAFALAMRNMWIMYCVFAGLGIVCSLFIRKAILSREHEETVTGIKEEKSRLTEDVELR